MGLSDLTVLDYSENSGQSFRIEGEKSNFVTIGKSEELVFCKGVPHNKAALPIHMQITNMNRPCPSFLNKTFET